QPEALDHHSGMMRRQRRIDEQRYAAVPAQRLVKLHDRAAPRDRDLAGLLAQLSKELAEERILEFLCRNRRAQAEPTEAEAEPFPIAVVKSGHDNRPARHSFGADLLQVREFNVFAEIFTR